jgi:hypothetical protein
LKKQQRELHAELGPSPAPELDIYGASFRSGRYDIIENEFTRLQQTVTPCGILGGDEEKQLWRMFQLIIRIAFKKGQPDLAIERLDRYEQTRIGVKLTPIPDFDLQELALGYLAQQSLDLARSRLKHWLSNSRMPIITDTIKQHEAFRDIFD